MESSLFATGPLKKALIIGGVSLILGVLFTYFFYDKALGIAFPIFVALISVAIIGLEYLFRRTISATTALLTVSLLFFSVMVFVRDSAFLTFINVSTCIALLLLIARAGNGDDIRQYTVGNFLAVIATPFKFITPLLGTFSDLTLVRQSARSNVAAQIIKGIVITIPVVAVFGALFVSADLVIKTFIKDLAIESLTPETIARIIITFFVTLIFIGAYSFLFGSHKAKTPREKSKHILGTIEISILFGSLNAVFLAFIIVQLAYLFGGAEVLGFMYADYARKGFFELITVSLLTFFLLRGAERYVEKKEDGNHSLWFKILSAGLVVQVLVVMLSAFRRLALYEQAFGFTELRLYSHICIIWLAVVVMFLLYKIFVNNRESLFARLVFSSVVIFIALINLFNPEKFIAEANIARFAETGDIDSSYLLSLSADARPTVVAFVKGQSEEIESEFFPRYYYKQSKSEWQAFHLARAATDAFLEEKGIREEDLEKNIFAVSAPLGTRVGEMTIVATNASTSDPIVQFEGDIKVTGDWDRRGYDDDKVCMNNLTSASIMAIPRLDDTRDTWFCFENDAYAREMFGPVGASGKATVIISAYLYTSRRSDTGNSATLKEVIKKK